MNTAIITAIIGALVAITGWIVSHYLLRIRDDRTRRIERRLAHIRSQIEEFYGPLFNLVRQMFAAQHVLHTLVDSRVANITAKQIDNARAYFHREYFVPLHQEITGILKSKLYLVEGVEVPMSFHEYLRHSIQEKAQRDLWEQSALDSSQVPGIPWPVDFYEDIESGLKTARIEFDRILQLLNK